MSNITQEDIDALHQSPRSANDTDVTELCEKIAELQADLAQARAEAKVNADEAAALRKQFGAAMVRVGELQEKLANAQSWRESMEKDLAKYRELAIAAIDVTLLAEECEGDDGEQVFTVNGERFTRLNDLADFFSADGTASILPDAEDSTQPKAQLDPDGNLAGPDFEDGPEFEGWEQRSGQPKSRDDSALLQLALDALEHHGQMTRPLFRTIEAMEAIRERLALAPKPQDSVDEQLARDGLTYGAAYLRIDADGARTRIDPATVMIAPQPDPEFEPLDTEGRPLPKSGQQSQPRSGWLTVPIGHFWRGDADPFTCKHCGFHHVEHIHTDEASRCPSSKLGGEPHEG